jgi:ribokinase
VAGSANVDLTVFTDQFPRPGETIFGREFHLGFGGKGANQAVAARLCGANVTMIARVGDDLFGEATVQNFRSFGIDASRVKITKGVSSGVAPIFVDSSGQNRIIVVKGANDLLLPEDIDHELLKSADLVVMQLEIPLETVYHTMRVCRSIGVKTILNPAPAQTVDLTYANYVIPNETEAEALTGIAIRNLDDARAAIARLQGRVIITLGSNGALSDRHHEAFKVQPIDTTGAGDAFIGSFACFLGEGFEESEAIRRANVYAALSTQSVGTQKSFVRRSVLEQHLPPP